MNLQETGDICGQSRPRYGGMSSMPFAIQRDPTLSIPQGYLSLGGRCDSPVHIPLELVHVLVQGFPSCLLQRLQLTAMYGEHS